MHMQDAGRPVIAIASVPFFSISQTDTLSPGAEEKSSFRDLNSRKANREERCKICLNQNKGKKSYLIKKSIKMAVASSPTKRNTPTPNTRYTKPSSDIMKFPSPKIKDVKRGKNI